MVATQQDISSTGRRALNPPVLAEQRQQSIDELDAAIVSIAGNLNAETYRLLVLLREFDDRLGWARWSFASCAEWLAWRLGLSLSAAREKVRTAHALRGLPVISKAFAEGQISYSKVRAMTRVVTLRNEALLLSYAQNATAAQVEERCRQIRNTTAESTDVAERAWQGRSLTVLRQAETDTMRITLEVPIEDGELFVKAVDRAVEAGKGALGQEFDTNGWHAEQADAAVEIARSYLGAGESAGMNGQRTSRPAATADHYQVVVHVDQSALSGGMLHQKSAESLSGGISHRDGAGSPRADLPIETIRRLTCDGSIVEITEDASGNPLDIGRRTRTVPAPLKRALYARDRGCTFPGCHRTHYLDAHHIVHWAKGGETSANNLTLLCTLHHRLLHEGRFSIGRDVDGEIYFARRDGRVIPRCGYRSSDYVDDGADDADDSFDDRTGDIREPRGFYVIAFTPPAWRPSRTT